MYFKPQKRLQLCPQLTVSLSHLQQDRLLQHNRERLVLLILLIIDDLYIQQLPKTRRTKEQEAKERWMN